MVAVAVKFAAGASRRWCGQEEEVARAKVVGTRVRTSGIGPQSAREVKVHCILDDDATMVSRVTFSSTQS